MLRDIEHHCKTGQATAGIMVDLQKAFDSVWIDGLLFRLHEIGITGKILKTLCSFLRNRQIQLSVNGHTSDNKPCNIGVPQGSILSPILFTIYIRDMLDKVEGNSLQYADDTTIISSQPTDTELSLVCQTNCSSVNNWLNKWRMNANANKTDFIIFKGNATTPHLGTSVINKVTETKVLGLVIDHKLNFTKQLQKSKHILEQKWNLVKPFIHSGLHITASKRILTLAIIPKALYLAFIWDTKEKLSLYKILKSMLNVPFHPPTQTLHTLSGIKPIPLQYLQGRLALIKQLLAYSNDNIGQYPRSNLTKLFQSDIYKLNRASKSAEPIQLTKPSIKRHLLNTWVNHWKRFCLTQGASNGLLYSMQDPSQLILKPIPTDCHPKTFGSLCALLSGHTRLQLHTYNLGLTYSPTCICLLEDETPHHFLHVCPCYEPIRKLHKPTLGEWDNIVQYLEATGRNP